MSFILASDNRKEIVKTLLEYPKRQWSCSALEELTKIPHATVFRTLFGLKYFGILKTTKINKKDIIYELAGSPLSREINRVLNVEKITAKSIAINFANRIKSKGVYAVILYGSSVTGILRPDSDIDILVILYMHNPLLEKNILDIAGEISAKANKTLSAAVMDKKELNREKNSQFIKSVRENMEVLYGKGPF